MAKRHGAVETDIQIRPCSIGALLLFACARVVLNIAMALADLLR
jgi:hypothetical protein